MDGSRRELVLVTTQGKSLKLELAVDGLADFALLLKSGAFPSTIMTVADELSEYTGSRAA